MDKQKQILEIAEVIAKYISSRDFEVKFITNPKSKAFPFSHTAGVAEDLYNAGCRKIPENALVILDEEMEEFAETLLKSPQMQKTMNGLIKAWEKETAEKFAQALENRLDSIDTILHEDNEEEYLSANELGELIDEICREIAEGKV
jgi:hypothetical protein